MVCLRDVWLECRPLCLTCNQPDLRKRPRRPVAFTLDVMLKDPSKIPPGGFCYRVYPLQPGETLSTDIGRFGRDLREYSYHPGFKEVLCPYWQRTGYGTVQCSFMEREVLDDEYYDVEQAVALLAARIGEDAARAFPRNWALPDEIKICGVGEDRDDPWAYDA